MQISGICEVANSQWKTFLTNFAKNWKERHFTVNGHRSFKLASKVTFLWYFSEIGTSILKLVLEISKLVRLSSAFNKGDLFKN